MVTENYPTGFVGNIDPSRQGTGVQGVGLIQTPQDSSFNSQSFKEQKEREGFVLEGNKLIKYGEYTRRNSKGEKQKVTLIDEEIELTDNGYIERRYDVTSKPSGGLKRTLKSEKVYEGSSLVYEEKLQRGLGGGFTDRVRTDYVKGTEKTTPLNKSVSSSGGVPSNTNRPVAGQGLIITSSQGSNIYNVEQGISNPTLVATTKEPIKTTGRVEKVEIGTETINVISSESKPVLKESPSKQFDEFPKATPGKELTAGYNPGSQYAPKEGERPTENIGSIGEESIRAFKTGTTIGIIGGATLGVVSFGQGVGEGVLSTIEFGLPYSILQSKFQIPIIQPAIETVQAIPEIPEYAVRNPFQFAGQLYGGFETGKIVSSKIPKVTTYDKAGLVQGTENFITDVSRRSEVYGRQTVKGTVPFIIQDTSAPLKAQTLSQVTGDRYIVQTTIFGEPTIQTLKEPGFLTKAGVQTVEKTPENLIIPTGQTKLFEDTVTNFPRGRTETPNVMLETRSIEGTNPQGLQPSRIPETQKTLFESEPSKPFNVNERNTLKELYGKSNEPAVQEIPKVDNSKFFDFETPQGTITESVVTPRNVLELRQGPRLIIEEPVVETPAQSFNTQPKQSIAIYPALNIKSSTRTESKLKESTIPELSLNNVQSNEQTQFQEYKVNQKYDIKQSSAIESKLKSEQEVSLRQIQTQQQEQQLKQEQYFETPKQPIKQKTTEVVKDYFDQKEKAYEMFNFQIPKKNENKKVILFVRKKGKFEKRGLFETPGEAFKLGIKETSSTARASFKTVYEGENKPFVAGVLPEQFTRSKKDQFVVVQKRQYRISDVGEKKELRQAKAFKKALI